MKAFILYLFVGGLIIGLVDRQAVIQCNKHFPDNTLFTYAVLWPATLGIAITTTSVEGPLCADERNEK